MAWRVSTAGFEGPFDLLLSLVLRQKVDIGAVSVSDIADQYLAELKRMGEIDLEVASDFVLVASTLLNLKAASLVPTEDQASDEDGEDAEELSPDELREVLIARLLAYRQFKSAAAALSVRMQSQARMHPRTAGPGPEFADVAPDYLEGVQLERLAQLCAGFLGRRERVLLASEHIAPRRLPLETRVAQVDRVVRTRRRLTFDELLGEDASVPSRVVSLLALLELSKRHMLTLEQAQTFGTIVIEAVEGASSWEELAGGEALTDDGVATPLSAAGATADEEGRPS